MSYRSTPKPRLAPMPKASAFAVPTTPAEYSAPPHSLDIWLSAKGELCLGIPSAHGKLGHTLKLPTGDPEFLTKTLLGILARRQAEPQARIATPAVPVQAMIDAMARSEVKPTLAMLKADRMDDEDFLD